VEPTKAPGQRLTRPLRILLWLVNAVLILGLLVYLRPLIVWALNIASPFFVALIVAYIFNPIVAFFERRLGTGRALGVVVTYAVILGVTVLAFILLLPPLVAQLRTGISNLVDRVPVIIAALSEQLHLRVSADDLQRLQAAIEGRVSWDNLANQLTPAVRAIGGELARMLTSISTGLASAAAYSAGFVGFLILVLMITFYCLIDFGRIGRIVRVVVPPAHRDHFFATWHKIDGALGGFLRGQLIVCVIIGTLYSLGLVALGMKQYSLLIGFAAGFGNLIPYVGPIVGAVPTILWIIFGGVYATAGAKLVGILLVLLLSVTIQTFDGFFLQPRIVGRSAGLHPLLVLAALAVGAQFGLGGLVLAVPSAIIVRVLVRELWWQPLVARRSHEEAAQIAMQGVPRGEAKLPEDAK
jgi:predicted PurR-regulated permease PerM